MRTNLLLFITLLSCFLGKSTLLAATYYLSNQTDFDNFDCTALVAGDEVLLARGVTFYGQLDICRDHITIGAYGTGDDPVISGERVLSAWTSCTSGCPEPGTWYASLSQAPTAVFINGAQATLARYPDSGYRTLTGATSTTITDNTLTYNPGWTGAGIHVRTSNWTWENKAVSAYNPVSKTFTLASSLLYTPEAGFAFYLDGLLSELDADNEWHYDGSPDFRLYLKLPADPSGYTVTASIYDYGINCDDNLEGISISNIRFQRQKRHGVQMAGSSASGNSISNCTFDGQYEIGANLSGSSITVSGCTFRNQNGRGIHAEELDNATISNNTLEDIGQTPGYGTSGNAGLAGIAIYGGTENLVANNTIDNIGYIGIIFDCDNSVCEYNKLSNCMTKTSDGAGIKSYGPSSHHNVIRYNSVSACNGDPTTTPFTDFLTSAIYMDFYCHDNRIDSNFIYDQPKAGIQINKDNTYDTIRGNIVFGSKMGIMFLSGLTAGEGIENCHVRRNVFYTLQLNGAPVLIANMGASGLPGTLDSNYYCNPWQDTVVLRRLSLSNFTPYNLANWQSHSGQDAHTAGSYFQWTYPDSDAELYKNETTASQPYSLSGYVDLDNNPVTNFTLAPFTAKVVVQDMALPVEYLSPLRASLVPQGVLLQWTTAAAQHLDRFEVERSTDGREFANIGQAPGQQPESGVYAFLDEKPLPGVNYYRLRQVDLDETMEYSKVVAVDLTNIEGLPNPVLRVFPNPVSGGELTVVLPDNLEGETPVQLFDSSGRLVRSAVLGGGANVLDVSGLAAGVYTLRAGRFYEKIVVD
jgi:hypothetical protein